MPLDIDNLADDDIDFSTQGGEGNGGGEPAQVASASSDDAPPNAMASPAEPGGSAPAGAEPASAPEPAATPAEPAAAAQPQVPWYQAIGQEFNLQLGADEDTAKQSLTVLLNRARQIAQQHAQEQQWADYGRRAYEEAQQRQAQAQQAAQPQPAQPQQPQLPWRQVELSAHAQAWIDPVSRTLRPEAPDLVKNEYMQWAAGQRQMLEAMYQRPQEVLTPLVQQTLTPLEQRLQQLEQQFQQIPVQQQAQQFAAANAGWMMQNDPLTGQYTYTPAGQRFMQYVQQANQFTSDPKAIQDYGMNMLQRDLHAAAMRQLENQLVQAGITPITHAGRPQAPQQHLQAAAPVAALAPPPATNPVAQHQANRQRTLAAGAAQIPQVAPKPELNGRNRMASYVENLMAANGLRDEDIDFTR